jgi:putative transposase
MSENKALFKNKYRAESTRLKYWNYSNPGFYFVTICTKDRENMFGEIVNGKMVLNEYGYVVKNYWHDLPNYYKNCISDSFIIMPNHFHGIIQIKETIHDTSVEMIHESSLRESSHNEYRKQRRKMLLPKIIGRFKMQSSKKINLINHTTCFNWQKSYYEHIVHTEWDLWNIREYIKNNPINWINDGNYKK